MKANRLFLACATLFSLATGACVGPAPAPPIQQHQRAAPPSPPPPPPSYGAGTYRRTNTSWLDAPLTVGNWRLGRAAAEFTSPDGAIIAGLQCYASRRTIVFAWPRPQSFTSRTVTVTTTSMVRSIDVPGNGTASDSDPYLQLAFQPSDPLLDAIAFSRGRFMIETSQSRTILPVRPEVARIIEDCRSSATG